MSQLPTLLPVPVQYLMGRQQMSLSPSTPTMLQGIPESLGTIGTMLSIVGAMSGMYHGYIRNGNSLGWGIGWMAFGSLLPIISIPLSLAQGFAQQKPQGVSGLSGIFNRRRNWHRAPRRSRYRRSI